MIEVIKKQVNGEEISGIIPLKSKGLKMKFGKNLTTGILGWIVIFLLSTIPAGMFSFILGDLIFGAYAPQEKIFALSILVFGIVMYLLERIYANVIRKYPSTFLVVTNANLHFFLIKGNGKGSSHKFEVDVEKLEDVFYGQINKNTNRIGQNFAIKQNDKTLLSGKLSISKNQLFSEELDSKYFFPIEKLQNIFLS